MDSQRAGQGNWATIDALLEIFTMEQVGQIVSAYRKVEEDGGQGEVRIIVINHHPRFVRYVIGHEFVRPD